MKIIDFPLHVLAWFIGKEYIPDCRRFEKIMVWAAVLTISQLTILVVRLLLLP